jgi:hypothetical protein
MQDNNEFSRKLFWKEKTFWTDGYFVSTIGEVSSGNPETLYSKSRIKKIMNLSEIYFDNRAIFLLFYILTRISSRTDVPFLVC